MVKLFGCLGQNFSAFSSKMNSPCNHIGWAYDYKYTGYTRWVICGGTRRVPAVRSRCVH